MGGRMIFRVALGLPFATRHGTALSTDHRKREVRPPLS